MTIAERKEKNRLRSAALRAADPEKSRAYQRMCYARHRDDRLTKRRAYEIANRDRITAQKRALYVPHPKPTPKSREEKLALKRAYREAHLSEVLARDKAYKLANLAKVRARTKAWKLANREKWYAGAKRWASKNPIALRAFAANRRARVARLFVEDVDPTIVFARDQGQCGICNTPVDPNSKWEIDHVIPIAKGGAHAYDNVQLAHRKCNRSKSAKVPHGQPTLFQVVA